MLATVLALGLAACGGDDEDGTAPAGTAPARRPSRPTRADARRRRPPPRRPRPAARPRAAARSRRRRPAEDQEAAPATRCPRSSQALFTGNGGKLSPGTVRVPPFIAIRVQLRSADGVSTRLTGGGKTIKAGGEIESAGTTFDGLRARREAGLTRTAGQGHRTLRNCGAWPPNVRECERAHRSRRLPGHQRSRR